jgi:hypothetical protein
MVSKIFRKFSDFWSLLPLSLKKQGINNTKSCSVVSANWSTADSSEISKHEFKIPGGGTFL